MRLNAVSRASELNVEGVDIEFVHEGEHVTQVIIRDPSNDAEIRIQKENSFGYELKVLQREDYETAKRYRVSGTVVEGVDILEYYDNMEDALSRKREIHNSADASVTAEEVDCYLDDHGEVVAEIE